MAKAAVWGTLTTLGFSLLLVAVGVLLFERFAEA
jgi:hypothetical protein